MNRTHTKTTTTTTTTTRTQKARGAILASARTRTMQHLRRHGRIGYATVALFLLWVPCDCTLSQERQQGDPTNGNKGSEDAGPSVSYGTEVSWPMQRPWSAESDELLANDQQRRNYIQFMEGCAVAYGRDLCESNEQDRVAMNAAQPVGQRNFTSTGYAKVLAPAQSFQALRDFWYTHYDSDDDDDNNNSLVDEEWPKGNIYTNHWKAPTKTLLVDSPDPDRPKLSVRVRRQLFQEVQKIMEHWSGGVPLVATAMYGIRAYTRGSIGPPQVDRPPRVLSALIHVAHEGLEEDWPLELVLHDGSAVNVNMKPGEMLLYESHSILHGRPFPLQGDIYANLILHFEPIGFTAEAERRRDKTTTAKENFMSALLRTQQNADSGGGQSVVSSPNTKVTVSNELPYYIKEGTVEADRWRQHFVFQRRNLEAEHAEAQKVSDAERREYKGNTQAHRLAMSGDLGRLRQLAEEDPAAMDRTDINGWKPIHEAARSGSTEVIQFLIEEHHVDVNERTNGGNGATPLWWAEFALHPNHEAIALLRRHGAIALAPRPE